MDLQVSDTGHSDNKPRPIANKKIRVSMVNVSNSILSKI